MFRNIVEFVLEVYEWTRPIRSRKLVLVIGVISLATGLLVNRMIGDHVWAQVVAWSLVAYVAGNVLAKLFLRQAQSGPEFRK